MPPTVITAEAGSRIEQEEVFGPVLTLVGYEPDEYDENAHRVATSTPYGLAGAVWAPPRSAAATSRPQCESARSINGGAYNPTAPFGGFGASGYGRELCADGIEEFTSVSVLNTRDGMENEDTVPAVVAVDGASSRGGDNSGLVKAKSRIPARPDRSRRAVGLGAGTSRVRPTRSGSVR